MLRGMKCYNADEIDQRIKVKKSWDLHYERKKPRQDDSFLIQQLHQAAQLIFAGSDSRIMCYSSGMSIYSNDLFFLNLLTENDCIGYPRLFKAVIDRPRNSIKLNHSTFSYRTYLKANRPSNTSERKHFENLLKNQVENIRLSPNLDRYVNSNARNKYSYCDNFFIVHSRHYFVVKLSESGHYKKNIRHYIE